MLRRKLFAMVIASALVTLVAPVAVAGAGKRSTTGPVLTGPTGIHVGETYMVSGSGFVPGSWVPLEITEAGGCCLALGMVADETGAFAYTGLAFAPGWYRVRAAVQRHGSGRWRTAAEWTFEAYP